MPSRSHVPLLLLASLVVSGVVPSAAGAQPATEKWPGLRPAGLDTVFVRDVSGTETSGKLLQLNPDSLLLLAEGHERRFELAEVDRIQKRDSLKNGTLAGVIVGIAMGALAAGISDCPGDDPGGGCAGARTATFAISVGVYTALGTGIDALIRGRTTVYESPNRSSASLSLSPVRRAGLVSLTW